MNAQALERCRQSVRTCLTEYRHPAHALWRALELALLAERRTLFTGRVLDLGCGEGSFTRMLLGRQVTFGFDRNRPALARARAASPQSSVTEGDVCALPFPSAAFDVVFSNCVLEHVPRLEICLDQVARVLKPGGLFIFTVPSERMAGMTEINRRLEMLHFLSPEQWRSILARRGLMVQEEVGYLSPATFQIWLKLFRIWELSRVGLNYVLSAPFVHLPGGVRFYLRLWEDDFTRLVCNDAPGRTVEEPNSRLVVARAKDAGA